jgi:hypothetical protein
LPRLTTQRSNLKTTLKNAIRSPEKENPSMPSEDEAGLNEELRDPENWVYDDEGIIYLDPAGRLKDKNDRGFSLPKVSPEKEHARLALFNVVNTLLKTDEFPFAKETYKRLREQGAGELEARALMVTVWTNEIQQIMQMPETTDEERMIARLAELQPYERDSSGAVKR